MKSRACLLVCTLIVLCAQFAFSQEQEMGNAKKGKYLYRKNCLNCHLYGTEKQLGPDSKTRSEWKAAFANEKIKTYSCAAHWAKLSEEDIFDIFTHMYEHASDSPAPASCK